MALTAEQIKKLKKGDKLKRVTPYPSEYMFLGGVYTVSWFDSIFVTFEEVFGSFALSSFDLVTEDNMEFNKNMLKPFMRVKLRNGNLRMVALDEEDNFIFVSDHWWLYPEGGHYTQFDVMQVYACPKDFTKMLKHTEVGELLWERKEETEAQKQYKKLEEQMKNLQKELDKLQPML